MGRTMKQVVVLLPTLLTIAVLHDTALPGLTIHLGITLISLVSPVCAENTSLSSLHAATPLIHRHISKGPTAGEPGLVFSNILSLSYFMRFSTHRTIHRLGRQTMCFKNTPGDS